MPRKHITIRDVAARAGVSTTTVSRVLNNKGEVTPDTRERVRQAMAEMEFTPSQVARGMAMVNSRTIGYVVSDMTNPFQGAIIQAIHRVAQNRNYRVGTRISYNDVAEEVSIIEALVADGVDGLILTLGPSAEVDRVIDRCVKEEIPIVCTSARPNNSRVSQIVPETEEASYQLVHHLISLGHRRIAHIEASAATRGGRTKLAGYTRAMAEAGLPTEPELVVTADYDVDDGARAAMQLFGLPQPPTAIFATNDMVAMGTLMAAQQAGISVPDELSVAGFDDIVFARCTNPPLTTVFQPGREIGETAVKMLLEMIEASAPPQVISLSLPLVIRQSTGPCRESRS